MAFLSEKALEHCASVGADKKGLTNCRNCPGPIRQACTSGSSGSMNSIIAWHKRINKAVDEHYAK